MILSKYFEFLTYFMNNIKALPSEETKQKNYCKSDVDNCLLWASGGLILEANRPLVLIKMNSPYGIFCNSQI